MVVIILIILMINEATHLFLPSTLDETAALWSKSLHHHNDNNDNDDPDNFNDENAMMKNGGDR